ncbi:MAG: AAA family ATPase [Promethearchaeota archaeon]
MSDSSDYFRNKVWYIINTIQANQLFVHSANLKVRYSEEEMLFLEKKDLKTKKKSSRKKKKKLITKNLPEILTVCILNTLVPNSAMLLVGGHGGGKTSIVKYLGRMFTGMSLDETEECIIRAHPQLTEEKIIATLNIKKLMKDGEEEVIWRTFASNFWKIIDEVNRCSPYTQNILLSLLAEGKIKYYDSVLNVSKYCLFGTLNPNDVGTFEMSAPFLDRFGISVPISMPKSQDLAVILESQDEKLGGYDELIQVPQVLTEEQLLSIWYEVSTVPCSKEAENFIHAIIRDYTLCERLDKGNSDYLKPSSGLCSGCHFNVPNKVPCSNTDSILSVRVAKDLLRYSRALTWLLSLKEVSVNIVLTVAPYVISHRVVYLERALNKDPYWGSKYLFTKNILKMVLKRFQNRIEAYEIIDNFREGNGSEVEKEKLEIMARNDLIVRIDLLPLAESLSNPEYVDMVNEINESTQQKNISKISTLRRRLLQEIDFPNRGELIARLNGIMRVLTLNTYNCSMELWNSIRFTIDGQIPQFSKKLKETTLHRGTYRLRTEDLDMEINVTGVHESDIVNFSFFGGDSAEILKDAIEKQHKNAFKSMDDLIEESKIAREKIENELGLSDIEVSEKIKEEKYFDDDLYD